MNFLQLSQRLRQEAGVSGSGPSTVVSQTGEMRRIVDWVAEAWYEIQMSRKNWMWMRGTFAFNTTASDDDYTSAEAGIASRFSMWDTETFRIYATSEGVAGETILPYLGYNDFIRTYHVGTRTTGLPVCFTIGNDRRIILGPKPDKQYTVSGEYWKSIQTLSADADTPDMPDEFHPYIVYKALEKYGLYESAIEVVGRAVNQQKFYKRVLETNQLPMMEAAETLC